MANIPFEVLVLFLGIAFTIGIIGIILAIKKVEGSPFLIVFAGILIFGQVVLTENIEFPNAESEIQDVSIQELYHLHSWNSELSIFGTGNTARAIFVTADSGLVSDNFFNRLDCVQFPIGRTGSPTGNATIGIFADTDDDIFPIQFGTIDVSTIPLEMTWFEFCLDPSFHHFIEAGDRIGIAYDGGNSTNFIRVGVDSTNPIDSNLFMQRFSSGTLQWENETAQDMAGVLYNRATTQNIVPYSYEFNQFDNWAFMIMLSALFIFIGVMVQLKKW